MGGCQVFRHTKPLLLGEDCLAKVSGQSIGLDPEQAGIAATIAGVGHRVGVPRGAVTVAFATALQESKLHDVDHGDRDSVGIFQQRPSQGWGTPSQLRDPVYAATRFFAALVTVPGYQDMPVYRAAQAVQHSADGTAYGQYAQVATLLSAAFTGNSSRAVWCWYRPYAQKKQARLAAAGTELERTFGPATTEHASIVRGAGGAGSVYRVETPAAAAQVRAAGRAGGGHAPRAQTGWEIASWAVTHAKTYGIGQVRYAGFVWHASNGQHGWKHDAAAPVSRVELG